MKEGWSEIYRREGGMRGGRDGGREGGRDGGREDGERVSVFVGRIRGMTTTNCCGLLIGIYSTIQKY